MSIITDRRIDCINKIAKTLNILHGQKLLYNKKRFLDEIMKEYQICEKTADEYFRVAVSFFENKKPEDEASKILKRELPL